jgi:hypothetical protein
MQAHDCSGSSALAARCRWVGTHRTPTLGRGTRMGTRARALPLTGSLGAPEPATGHRTSGKRLRPTGGAPCACQPGPGAGYSVHSDMCAHIA